MNHLYSSMDRLETSDLDSDYVDLYGFIFQYGQIRNIYTQIYQYVVQKNLYSSMDRLETYDYLDKELNKKNNLYSSMDRLETR